VRVLAFFLLGAAMLLLVPTVVVHLENSGSPSMPADNLSLPPWLQRTLGATFLVGSIFPASLLWAIGIRKFIVAAGGDVAYFTPLGILIVYGVPATAILLFRRRNATSTATRVKREGKKEA
jgi:hypothetical protein